MHTEILLSLELIIPLKTNLMKKIVPLINLNDCSQFITLPHESDNTCSQPKTLQRGKHGTSNLSPAISQMASWNLHKISLQPRKGAPETVQEMERTVVGQVFNTRPLRLFFNITFYIKGFYRGIKINFT